MTNISLTILPLMPSPIKWANFNANQIVNSMKVHLALHPMVNVYSLLEIQRKKTQQAKKENSCCLQQKLAQKANGVISHRATSTTKRILLVIRLSQKRGIILYLHPKHRADKVEQTCMWHL